MRISEKPVSGAGLATEILPAASNEGSVMLDIGADTGAAVVRTETDLAGAEIEIRPRGSAWNGTHVAVRERRVGGDVLYAAVFGALRAGSYDLRVRFGPANGTVLQLDVVGARVTHAEWPGLVAQAQ